MTSSRSSILRLRGLTLKGKNRIYRGGERWRVVREDLHFGLFLESVNAGPRECFWMDPLRDPNVEVVRGI